MLFIKRKKLLIIINIVLILLTPTISENTTIKKIQTKLNINSDYSTNIKKTINEKKEYPLLVIEIPKINLYKKVYNIQNSQNNIEKNIKILPSSSLEKNTIILASHSGTNKNAYFNNLINLSINDLIYVQRKDKKYIYQINKIYYINKTGYLEISKNLTNTIFLITCSTNYKDKQLIIEGILIK